MHSLPFVYLTWVDHLHHIVWMTPILLFLILPLAHTPIRTHAHTCTHALTHARIWSPTDFVPLCLSSCQSIRAVKSWCNEQARESVCACVCMRVWVRVWLDVPMLIWSVITSFEKRQTCIEPFISSNLQLVGAHHHLHPHLSRTNTNKHFIKMRTSGPYYKITMS